MTEWNEILDLERATKNVRTDIFGDWHRDPWNWPETEWLTSSTGIPYTLQALNAAAARRSYVLDVPKENFSVRPALVFDPVDRLVVQGLVDCIGRKLIGSLPRWVCSWRLSRKAPRPGMYVDQREEWATYRGRLEAMSSLHDAALLTDVVSFFASIPIPRLIDRVYECAGSSKVTDRLASLLTGWSQVVGRGGLPMRANAASVLASAYLRPVDDVLMGHGRAMAGSNRLYSLGDGTACRWVDDIWLFGDDRADLRSAQLDIQEALQSLGLHMNLGKTELVAGEDMMSKARQLEHSAVDVALSKDQPNFEPLNLLIDRIAAEPETVNRTAVRFATVRMRKARRFERVGDLADVAMRMPHASDALGRLFFESNAYMDMENWYVDYSASKWSKIGLAAANLGRMFPGSRSPNLAVMEIFEKHLTEATSLPLVSLAAQRLATWSSDSARLLFRELAPKVDHPQIRRVLAFAALNAGETRDWVSRLLGEFQENATTLTMLRERNFASIPATADFVGVS